jgi:hypothetical protein
VRQQLVVLHREHEHDADKQHDADEHDQHAQAEIETGLLADRARRIVFIPFSSRLS